MISVQVFVLMERFAPVSGPGFAAPAFAFVQDEISVTCRDHSDCAN